MAGNFPGRPGRPGGGAGTTLRPQAGRVKSKGFVLDLSDTPGHVDVGYGGSRSLAACEGVILLVDAAQGIEAQTLANCYLALENDLEIVACLNKIDLPAAEPERIRQQIEDVIGLDASDAVLTSAKTGAGIHELLEAIVHRLPAPKGEASAPLKAPLVDAWYDASLGAVVLVPVLAGSGRWIQHSLASYDQPQVRARIVQVVSAG